MSTTAIATSTGEDDAIAEEDLATTTHTEEEEEIAMASLFILMLKSVCLTGFFSS